MKTVLLRALHRLVRQQCPGSGASKETSSRGSALHHRLRSTRLDPTPIVHHQSLHDDIHTRLDHIRHQKRPRPLDNLRHSNLRLELELCVSTWVGRIVWVGGSDVYRFHPRHRSQTLCRFRRRLQNKSPTEAGLLRR